MSVDGEVDSEFGELLATRRGEALPAVIAIAIGLFGIGFVGYTASFDPYFVLIALLPGILLVMGCFQLRRALTVCEFHESGLVRSGPSTNIRLAYRDLEDVQYQLVRQYHNGTYTGTVARLKLVPKRLSGLKPVRIVCKHAERRIAGGVVREAVFESFDPLDNVVTIIRAEVSK